MTSFKCLDVLTKKEGELQLRPANFFIIWIVCIGIYWQTNYLLCNQTENLDARDLIDDFRRTQHGVQSWHSRHFWVGDGNQYNYIPKTDMPSVDWPKTPTLYRCGHSGAVQPGTGEATCAAGAWTRLSTKTTIKKQQNLKDPRFWETIRISLFDMSDTGYDIYTLKSVFTLPLTGPGVVRADITQRKLALTVHPKAGNCANDAKACNAGMQLVEMFHVSKVADSSQVRVRHLSRLEVEIGFYKSSSARLTSDYGRSDDAKWSILSVHATYADDNAWQGELDQSVKFEKSSASVHVVISDVSQPRGEFPSFTGTWRAIAGFTFFPCMTIVLAILRLVLQVWIETRSRENQGLPPPFYGGFRKYRGW